MSLSQITVLIKRNPAETEQMAMISLSEIFLLILLIKYFEIKKPISSGGEIFKNRINSSIPNSPAAPRVINEMIPPIRKYPERDARTVSLS